MRPQLTGPMKRSGPTSRTASSPVKRRSAWPAAAGTDRRHRRGASDFQNGVAVKLSRHHVRPPGAAIGADHLGQFAYATGPEQSYANGGLDNLTQRGPSNRTHGAGQSYATGPGNPYLRGLDNPTQRGPSDPRNGARAALHDSANPALSPSLRGAGRSVPGTERAIDPAIAARVVEPWGAVPNAS
jgi:hypothetical protein